MKTKQTLLVFALFIISVVYSQEKTFSNNNWTKFNAHRMPQTKTENWQAKEPLKGYEHNLPTGKVIYEEAEQGAILKRNVSYPLPLAITVHMGTNFEANNLDSRVPADNNIAISNSGKIISVDNYSIMEFDQEGNVLNSTPLVYFFPDATLIDNNFFDPKIIYDRYSDRYILVVMYHSSDYADSRILLAYSGEITDENIAWNYYDFKASDTFTNTSTTNYWFDYPNIGINKNELFITSNVAVKTNTGTSIVESILFQIDKEAGYLNMFDMPTRVLTNIQTGAGYNGYSIVPLSEGLQLDTYNDKMYFVSSEFSVYSDISWYEINGDINDNNPLISHSLASPVFCSVASYASQKGGYEEDRISTGDNRILSGFYRNNKLHFVLHRSDSGWMEVVYMKLNVSNNSISYTTYGGLEHLKNYLYPSISCMDEISSSDEKAILTYNRTSPNIYLQECAVNIKNNIWGVNRVIKKGLGLLNLRSSDGTPNKYERIGDYTDIQRKYDTNKSWLVGSYPFGTTPNNQGVSNGLNAWICEVSDVIIPRNRALFTLSPNPNNGNNINITFDENINDESLNFKITDIYGFVIQQKEIDSNSLHNISLPNLKNGIYFITLTSNTSNYGTSQVFINH